MQVQSYDLETTSRLFSSDPKRFYQERKRLACQSDGTVISFQVIRSALHMYS